MDDNQEPQEKEPLKKKLWYKRWSPRQFALYLMSIDMKYVLPGTSNYTILEEVPNLHCGLEKIGKLRRSEEFKKTVEDFFTDQIRSQFSRETMFWLYLKHSYNANMELPNPTTKLLDVLGYVSGEYAPQKSKDKGKGKMTPAQIARLIHERDQIEATLKAKNDLEIDEKDGEDEQ